MIWNRFRYALPRLIALPVRASFEHLTLYTARWREVHGVRVGVLGSGDATGAAVRKITAALELIAALAPRRLRRMQSDRVRIVAGYVKAAEYWYTSHTCVLGQDMLRDSSDAYVALALVHETTHARIARWGILVWPDLLARIEVRCHIEEIDFAQRLSREEYPGTDKAIAVYRERISILRSVASYGQRRSGQRRHAGPVELPV